MNALIDRLCTILAENLLISSTNPRGIKQVYKGDPLTDIPSVNMPCIIIDPLETRASLTDSCYDEKMQQVQVIVLLDSRKYFNAGAAETAKFELAKIMEEEDENLKLKNDTVLYAVRQTLIEDLEYSTGRNDEMPIIYGQTGEKEFPTVMAILTFTIQRVPYLRN